MAGKSERADKVILNLNFVSVFLTKSVMDKIRPYTERWNGGT